MKRFKVDPGFLFLTVLIALGAVFLLKGTINVERYRYAPVYEDVTETGCRTGNYVDGEISNFLIKKVVDLGDGHMTGISAEILSGGRTYYVFTIPVADGKYIRLLISNEETMEAMERVARGEEGAMFVEVSGKIRKASSSPALSWYEGIEGFDPNSLIADYEIRQTDIVFEYQCMAFGFFVIVYGTVMIVRRRSYLADHKKAE